MMTRTKQNKRSGEENSTKKYLKRKKQRLEGRNKK